MADNGNGKKGIAARLAGLFKGGPPSAEAAAPGEDYKGFEISADPMRQGSGWVTAGYIRKTVAGEVKEHRFVRADTHTSRDEAIAFSIRKAKQIVDEQEKTLFSD